MRRPNLFEFATSELSQDAFVCWLLSWADPSHRIENESLHDAAVDFLRALFERGGQQCPKEITQVEVKKQYHNIDILAIVNGTAPLLIEDKTHTKDHSGQLERYRTTVVQEFGTSAFSAIYLKTGDQCNYASIRKAGFGVFLRADLLQILKEAISKGVDSEILLNFHEYLSGLDAAVSAFCSTPVEKWDWSCWTGFFVELQKQLDDDAEWDYVPNPSGGFMGFWWHWRGNKYLQLEQDKLCFKIAVPEEEQQSAQRNEWHEKLTAMQSGSGPAISKPTRFGKGSWMTAAIVPGDYRKVDSSGCLDLASTVAGLREAEIFLDSVLAAAE